MSSGDKFMDDERFDGLYLNVANTAHGIEPLLDTVFSFLRRKTDFFNGPPGSGDRGTEAAIEKVNVVLRKHAEIHLKEQQQKKKKKKELPKVTTDESVLEIGKDGAFDVPPVKPQMKTEAEKSEPVVLPAKEDVLIEAESERKEEGGDDTGEAKETPPVGNGGTVEGRYVWTQSLSELNVSIAVPANTRGRDLNVTIAKKHLKVGLRAQPGTWIVDAPLVKAIICDDSFWTVEDGNRLSVHLQKLNQMEWWDGVCEGDPKIDVRKIQPENSSLNDLDGETRKTVEKMMYDQRQKAMGLPSSEEEQKLKALELFKKQHPELDFSNAKFN
jgi:hypothetical protein